MVFECVLWVEETGGGREAETTGKDLLQSELRGGSGVASRGGVALNYLPSRPKGGVTNSPGKDLSRRGGACFGRARVPNGIEICQVRVGDGLYTLHPN